MSDLRDITNAGVKKEFGHSEIIKMLPHRPPFLLVDKVIEVDLDKGKIVGVKGVTVNEPFFQGHFPSAPIMPGVLIVEALAQLGGILIYQKGYRGKIPVIMSLSNAKFRHPVRPGSLLELHCEGKHFSSKGGKVHAKAFVAGQLATQVDIGFALLPKELI